MLKFVLSIILALITMGTSEDLKLPTLADILNPTAANAAEMTPCTCGVFLSGQFNKTTPVQGNAVLMNEHDEHYTCNRVGDKQCINKCLDVLIKHLANSPAIICGAIDRDCNKERAYLFYKHCHDKWVNSNLSAGREYCCKDGSPVKCA